MAGVKFRIRDQFTALTASALSKAATRAEHLLVSQAAKDTEPYVPMLTGSLRARTEVKGNQIIYPGPYARYLYHGKVMVSSATGKGPMRFTDKNGNEVIMYPKGTKLKATDRDLQYSPTSPVQAQSHWFEESKAKNLEDWLRVLKGALKREL